MKFTYGKTEIDYLKARDKRLGALPDLTDPAPKKKRK